MQKFLGMQFKRCFLGRSVNAFICDFCQPPASRLVEMIERTELATIEQIGFNIIKWSFNFAFGLGPTDLASPRSVAIVRGESQESCVVDRLVIFPASHNDLHVIVEARRGDSAKMFESFDMLANGRFVVLPFGKVDILPSRVTEDVTEQLYLAASLLNEVDFVSRPVHLSLNSWTRLEANR